MKNADDYGRELPPVGGPDVCACPDCSEPGRDPSWPISSGDMPEWLDDDRGHDSTDDRSGR